MTYFLDGTSSIYHQPYSETEKLAQNIENHLKELGVVSNDFQFDLTGKTTEIAQKSNSKDKFTYFNDGSGILV